MEYTLIAKCDICGKSCVFEGNSDNSEQNDYISVLAEHQVGMTRKDSKTFCQTCATKYDNICGKHKWEIDAFLAGGK